MTTSAPVPSRPEVWLRGPLPDVPAVLQPVAHALLQASEEVSALLLDFPDEVLWERPFGLASVGFHLQHLSGVIDRLTTYARGAMLTEAQLHALRMEGAPGAEARTAAQLVATFIARVEHSVAWLAAIDPATVHDARFVGRGKLPSTVLGLLVHAAEHTMRHVGQLIVTVRAVRTLRAPDV